MNSSHKGDFGARAEKGGSGGGGNWSQANVLLSDAGAQLDLKLEKRNTSTRKKIDMKMDSNHSDSSQDFFDTMDHYQTSTYVQNINKKLLAESPKSHS